MKHSARHEQGGSKASEPEEATTGKLRVRPRDILFTVLLLSVFAVEVIALSPAGETVVILLVAGLLPIWSLVLLSVIERLLPAAGPRKSLKSWILHFQINVFFNAMLGIMTVAAFISCLRLAQYFGFEPGLFDIRFGSPEDLLILLGTLWLTAIVGDFFFYWYHRALHVNPFLWQHHKLHHTDTELEAVSTARQNWIEAIFVSLCITAPMILLFRVNPSDQWSAGILAGLAASSLMSFLTLSHMNVRWQVGWASVLWCSPQIHRIHHSLEPQHIDRNFAFVFPMWDVVFGTYYHPKKGEFPATGVKGESGFHSFREAETHTLREWLKFIRNRRGKIVDQKN